MVDTKKVDAKKDDISENKKNVVKTRPENIPAKFWNEETQEIRIDDVLKSYLELEKKLSQKSVDDDPSENVLELALETDGTEKNYSIALKNSMFAIDENINQRLEKAGFTNEQAQVVYDLCAEIIIPILEDAKEKFRAYRELEKLEEHFGGEERFDEISRQLLVWGEKNVPEDIFSSLNSSYYGVVALYNMMMSNEPVMMNGTSVGLDVLNETKLKDMMKDPKYWRDGDKNFVKKVEDGFKNLYGDER